MPEPIKQIAQRADWPKIILAIVTLTIVGVLVGLGKLEEKTFLYVLGLLTPKSGYTRDRENTPPDASQSAGGGE